MKFQILLLAVAGAEPLRTCLSSVDAVWPDDAAKWKAALPAWNIQYNTTPAVITYPKSVSEIQHTLKCARDAKVPVRPRSGGHSAIGTGPNGGVVVNMKHFSSIEIQDDHAWIGPAAKHRVIHRTLAEEAFGFPLVAHGGVGFGGFILGGGLSPFSHMLGIAATRLRAAEMVLANGTVVDVKDGELLRALKGGGGGHFGIVTRFKVALESQIPQIDRYLAKCELEVFNAMQYGQPEFPFSLSAVQENSTATIQVVMSPQGSSDITDVFKWLKTLPCEQPDHLSGGFLDMYDHLSISLRQGGAHTHAKSQTWFLPGDLPATLYDTLTNLVSDSSLHAIMEVMKLTEVPVSTSLRNSTSLPFLGSKWMWQMHAMSPTPLTTKQIKALDAIRELVRPYSNQLGYINYLDPTIPNWKEIYWGQYGVRLNDLKLQLDPTHLFQ